MKHADVCLVPFPFTDGSTSKVRPVVVVSLDEFNRGDDVVVVPLSSQPAAGDPFSISVEPSSPFFAATGLKTSSAIKWNKLMTISQRLLKRRLGKMHEDLMVQISKQIVAMISC
jgi:mRNA interferase MazF